MTASPTRTAATAMRALPYVGNPPELEVELLVTPAEADTLADVPADVRLTRPGTVTVESTPVEVELEEEEEELVEVLDEVGVVEVEEDVGVGVTDVEEEVEEGVEEDSTIDDDEDEGSAEEEVIASETDELEVEMGAEEDSTTAEVDDS